MALSARAAFGLVWSHVVLCGTVWYCISVGGDLRRVAERRPRSVGASAEECSVASVIGSSRVG